MSRLISPYGDRLVNPMAGEGTSEELKARAGFLPSVRLSERQTCDLELLATGAFSPLDRFTGAEDYGRVLGEMRLTGGQLFPVPVTLYVQHDAPIRPDSEVALRDTRNELLAVARRGVRGA